MTKDDTPPIPPASDLADLDADAVSLEDAIRRSNRIPKAFPVEDVLSLCAAARDIARADEADRPMLMQILWEQLAAMRKTVPRDADDATGEPEYQRLRYALSELTSEAAARALDVQDRPEPVQPDDPRLGPPDADAAAIRVAAAPMAEKGDEAILQIHGAIGPNARNTEFNLIKIVNSGKAEARLTGIAVENPETSASRLETLATMLTSVPRKLKVCLRGAGHALDFVGDTLPLFARLAKDLAELCHSYGADKKSPNATPPASGGRTRSPEERSAEDQLRLIESHLRRDDQERAAEAVARLFMIPGQEQIAARFKMDLLGSRVSDVAVLSGLTALQSLDFGNTKVSDVGALSGLTALQSLSLWGTPVSDVGPLSGLTALQSLDLRGTQVSDVGALSELPNLRRLNLPDGVEDPRPDHLTA